MPSVTARNNDSHKHTAVCHKFKQSYIIQQYACVWYICNKCKSETKYYSNYRIIHIQEIGVLIIQMTNVNVINNVHFYSMHL